MKLQLISLFAFFLLLGTACKKDKDKDNDVKQGTCSDGVLNQNETAVDCGGVCSVCPSCTDGMQNQGETGVDCGGPCTRCKIIYPDSGLYGKNLLSFNNYDTTMVPGYYSLAATVPANTTLTVVFYNLAGGKVNYGIVSGVGNWLVVNGPDFTWQKFVVTGPINADKSFLFGDPFFGAKGDAKMEIFYDNENKPNWIKFLRWK